MNVGSHAKGAGLSQREATAPGDEDAGHNEVLRAKYLDYCSAQLADLLVFISPDEIYLIAQRAAQERGDTGELSYTRMVQTATEWLADKVKLPPFEIWVEDYLAHPELYEEFFMGLWESEFTGRSGS